MAPLIQIKDQIFIKKMSSSQIHSGDIITFWQGSILVTHRVIRKFHRGGNTYFIEKGDVNANYSWISSKALVGKVIRIRKGNREINLDTLAWTIFNRIIGFSLLVAYGLRAIGRKTSLMPDWIKRIVRKFFLILENAFAI